MRCFHAIRDSDGIGLERLKALINLFVKTKVRAAFPIFYMFIKPSYCMFVWPNVKVPVSILLHVSSLPAVP